MHSIFITLYMSSFKQIIMSTFKPKTPARPESFSIIAPGVSPEAALLSGQLLNKNHKEFHCFFNDKKFHK